MNLPVWGSILFLSGAVSVQHAHIKSRRGGYWRLACKDYRHWPKDSLPGTRRPQCKRCLAVLTRVGVS